MKVLSVIVFIIILVFMFIFVQNVSKRETNKTSDITSTATPTPARSNESKLMSPSIVVKDVSKISLFSNLEKKLSAKDAKEEYACNAIINGGFYSAPENGNGNGKHLGLFATNGNVLSEEIHSSLFNGFFSVSNGAARITFDKPQIDTFALQTGPVLIKDGKPLNLSIENDERARRAVAIVTPQNEVIFLMLYDTNSLVSGPLLSEVPNILSDLDSNTSLDIKDAINLDGGAHSAFISEEVQLTDIQTPGGYFCIQK